MGSKLDSLGILVVSFPVNAYCNREQSFLSGLSYLNGENIRPDNVLETG